MTIATMSCGIAESRKMLKVLKTEFQNSGSVSSATKFCSPTHSPGPVSRFQSFSETTNV